MKNSTWLITSELANQRAQEVLLTCVVRYILNTGIVEPEFHKQILMEHEKCL